MKITLPISALFLSLAPLPAAVVYTQDFNNYTSSSIVALTAGWDGYTGTSDSIADNAHGSGLYYSGGAAGSSGPNATGGYLVAQNRGGAVLGTDYFLFTTAALNPSRFTSFSPVDSPLLEATANVNRSNAFGAGAGIRLTVLVDGAWYVSTTSIAPTTAPGSGETIRFTFATTSWTNLDLVTGAGGHLAIGTTNYSYASLFGAGQEVSGMGFYIDDLPVDATATRTLRIDDVTINTIPEPTAALLSLAGLTLFSIRRRK